VRNRPIQNSDVSRRLKARVKSHKRRPAAQTGRCVGVGGADPTSSAQHDKLVGLLDPVAQTRTNFFGLSGCKEAKRHGQAPANKVCAAIPTGVRGMGSYVAPLNFMTHNPIHPHTKHRARGTPLRPKYKHQERAKK